MPTQPTRRAVSGLRSRRAASPALGLTLALLLPARAVAGQSPAPSASPAPAPREQARVPTSHANVHKGPSSGQEVLVLVPKGTVLPIVGRRGEWVQVQLSPELRKTGMVMRWYADEKSGWMHDSTVVITKIKEQ
jgi:uncharacterized protein YgiM (DUF1202 family)